MINVRDLSTSNVIQFSTNNEFNKVLILTDSLIGVNFEKGKVYEIKNRKQEVIIEGSTKIKGCWSDREMIIIDYLDEVIVYNKDF